MGTYYSIKYRTENTSTEQELHAGIKEVLNEIDAQMSTYREDSEISRFNASREINQPFPVSEAVINVVSEAKRIHDLTDGGFDITVAPLVDLWGFGKNKKRTVPDAESIAAQRAKTGIENLQISDQVLIKNIPELSIDLSAIAKGFAVDQVAAYLETRTIQHYMIEIGGEVRTHGKNAKNDFWRIGIENPPELPTSQPWAATITLENESMATSGIYQNYFDEAGQRYAHVIDPRTGMPARDAPVSVSVIAPSCMTADALATGFSVLSPARILEIANAQNIPVFLITKEGDGWAALHSNGFKTKLPQQQ